MLRRVLIANRGEIAVRIIRACQELDIETVAVYSDADADSLPVQLADYAYRIGPADAQYSYLNSQAIIAAAQATHSDAIHPGYGFLSENADFADLVGQAGIVFIGPHADTIRLVGNKDTARDAMKQADLPMAPGTDPLNDLEEALKQAKDIGYPLMVKPVSGGGGKGMVVVRTPKELEDAVAAIKHASYTMGSFYLEKYISGARHIEVQIMSDNYGHVVHLGERECSLQRRNQKILEESPSSALTETIRQKVGEIAVKAAKHIHYTNVGTVEFLMDNRGQFYFMEVNPRIQVEHGITEMVTGIDLVKKQIKIAGGKPITYQQSDIKITGHAIECRINAEDPQMNFLPSPGVIDFYNQPGGPRVRVDSGVCAGSTVAPYYDSLIAKVITHGRTRGEAIKIMQRALSEFKITGIKTTIGLHLQVLSDPHFCSGNIDTQFVYRRMIS